MSEENNYMNGNHDEIENQKKQEDIFAEEDVVIPEEAKAENPAGAQQASGAAPETTWQAGQTADNAQQAGRSTESTWQAGQTADNAQQAGRSAESTWQAGRSAGPIPGPDSQNEQAPESEQAPKKEYSYIPNEKEARRQERKAKQHRMSLNAYVKAICTAILCGVIVGGCIIGAFAIGSNMKRQATVASTTVTTNEEKLAGSDADSADDASGKSSTAGTTTGAYTVSQIAENCSSSVVAITNKGVTEVQTLFGTMQEESTGSGSGVIVGKTDTELLIVTNNHVVEGSQELTVCFNDSEDAVYTAQIKGTDEDNDLAVVAVALSDMSEDVLNSISIATMGDSSTLQVGDQVVAIGNALGLGQSVTSGIVSALDREVTTDEDTTATLLQTDAAINPGNSGGALFNMNGELIGINSAKYASEQVEGMGFAIPISTAQPIIEELEQKETKTKLTSDYGYLNISGSDVSEDASEMYGVPVGVYVASATDGGAAANAGIQKGDIITSLDGNTVETIDELKELLQYYPAGDTVEVVIQRNSGSGYEEMTVNVTLDNASEQQSSTTDNSQSSQSGSTYGQQGGSTYGQQDGGSQNGSSYFGYGQQDDSSDSQNGVTINPFQ